MPKIWARFLEDDWNKRPATLTDPSNKPLLTLSDVFDGLVNAAEESRAGEWIDARLYADGRIIVTDREQYLPRTEDNSLNAYLDRLRASLPGQSCCLVIRDFHVYQPKLFMSLRELFHELYSLTGTPEETVVSVFVGNYLKTPFGIHTDNDHTFYCILEGKKQVMLWPSDYAKKRRTPWEREGGLGSTADAQYRADATTLIAERGQILYWPPRFWHCAEGPPGNTVAVSVGVAPPTPPFVADVLYQSILEGAQSHDLINQHRDLALPMAFARQIDVLQKHWPGLKQCVAESWLQRKSSGGFRRTPSPRKRRQLRPQDWVRAKHGSVSWIKHRKILTCASGGYTLKLQSGVEIEKALEKISAGGSWPLADLIKRATSKQVRRLISFLYEVRGIELVRE